MAPETIFGGLKLIRYSTEGTRSCLFRISYWCGRFVKNTCFITLVCFQCSEEVETLALELGSPGFEAQLFHQSARRAWSHLLSPQVSSQEMRIIWELISWHWTELMYKSHYTDRARYLAHSKCSNILAMNYLLFVWNTVHYFTPHSALANNATVLSTFIFYFLATSTLKKTRNIPPFPTFIILLPFYNVIGSQWTYIGTPYLLPQSSLVLLLWINPFKQK